MPHILIPTRPCPRLTVVDIETVFLFGMAWYGVAMWYGVVYSSGGPGALGDVHELEVWQVWQHHRGGAVAKLGQDGAAGGHDEGRPGAAAQRPLGAFQPRTGRGHSAGAWRARVFCNGPGWRRLISPRRGWLP